MPSQYCKKTTEYCCEEIIKDGNINKCWKDCIVSIDEIIEKASFHIYKKTKTEKCKDYKDINFGDAKAIKCDCIEKGREKAKTKDDKLGRNKSIDMVIGLNNNSSLLVELKLNVKILNGEKVKKAKVQYESYKKKFKNPLDECILIHCHNEKTIRNISNINKEKNTENMLCMTLAKFKETYF